MAIHANVARSRVNPASALSTQWFYAAEDNGRKVLRDCGRLEKIMEVFSRNATAVLEPCLVSFLELDTVGQSDFLLRLLQRGAKGEDTNEDVRVDSPSARSSYRKGVHLYADSGSRRTTKPILLAEVVKNDDDTGIDLYYAFLYAVSSCVVFVLPDTNACTLTAFRSLLDLGASIVNTKVSHRTPPCCIIVVRNNDGLEYMTFATPKVSLDDLFNTIPVVQSATLTNVVRSYYRLPCIIHASMEPSVDDTDDWTSVLYSQIRNACSTAPNPWQLPGISDTVVGLRRRIRDVWTFVNSRKQELTGLSSGPSQLHRAIGNFIPHVQRLCSLLEVVPDKVSDPQCMGSRIKKLHNLAALLTSCALLECVRAQRGALAELQDIYVKVFRKAMEQHLNSCQNAARTKVETPTAHQTRPNDISNVLEVWTRMLSLFMRMLCTGPSRSPDQAREHHADILEGIFHPWQPNQLFSNITCLCCLNGYSAHVLPCGHALCTACVKWFGATSPGSRHTFTFSQCLFHRRQTMWNPAVPFRLKPEGVGPRVMVLKGAGSRAVVQLELLSGIEKRMCELGGNRPIQIASFFDLIVGEESGALLAALLAKQRRGRTSIITVDSCTKAFIKMFPAPLRFRDKVISEKSSLFGGNRLFGESGVSAFLTRVAMVSSRQADGSRFVHANYRREEGYGDRSASSLQDADTRPAYTLKRRHDPRLELTIEEALSDAMKRPYRQKRKKPDQDDEIANVADCERRGLWPDTYPDLILFVGTGDVSAKQNLCADVIEAESFTPHDVTRNRGILDQHHNFDLNLPMKDLEGPKNRGFRRRFANAITGRGQKSEMDRLRDCVRRFLAQKHDDPRAECYMSGFRRLLDRLITSSFYMEIMPDKREPGHVICTITSIFEQDSQEMRWIAGVMAGLCTHAFTPSFLVQPNASNNLGTEIPAISSFERGKQPLCLDPVSLHVPVPRLGQYTACYLCLAQIGDLSPPVEWQISGSPRAVAIQHSKPEPSTK